jgi:hypothetical protein
VQRPRPALRAHQDEVAHLSRLGAHRVGHRNEPIAHEHRDRVGVIEDVGDLFLHQSMIHRRRDEPGRARRRTGQVVLDRVLRVDDDVPAGREPEPDEAVAQPVAPGHELGPAPDALPFDESGLVGVPSGVRGQDIHRVRCVAHRGGHVQPGQPGE